MRKVLLTVLKQNTDAFDFYTRGLNFVVDKNSPSRCGDHVADYEILSRRTTAPESHQQIDKTKN